MGLGLGSNGGSWDLRKFYEFWGGELGGGTNVCQLQIVCVYLDSGETPCAHPTSIRTLATPLVGRRNRHS